MDRECDSISDEARGNREGTETYLTVPVTFTITSTITASITLYYSWVHQIFRSIGPAIMLMAYIAGPALLVFAK